MLRALKTLIDQVDRLHFSAAASSPAATDTDHHVRLAAAVLLAEVMRADAEFGADEQQAVLGSLRGLFQLDAGEAGQLIELARSTAQALPQGALHLARARALGGAG